LANVLCQGTASQVAEKVALANVLYQGTASAVPERSHYDTGFSPCNFLIVQGLKPGFLLLFIGTSKLVP